MTPTLPLIGRDFDDPIALVHTSLSCLGGYNGMVNARQFLEHCRNLAAQLPDNIHAINLCNNRYLFLVSFCAVLLREQVNLLPPNKNTATQAKLSRLYSHSYVLHDGGTDIDPSVQALNIEELIIDGPSTLGAIPKIPCNQLAAISFTSGSTGDSKPNLKYWESLRVSSDINYCHMLSQPAETFYMVATVPAQHMWGLETSVFLPLHHDVCVLDRRPFYPEDVMSDLALLPSPRCLVTTPVHLRSIQGAHLPARTVALILCATSPLQQPLANDVEKLFSGELREVYGCSEVGSMAVRKTAIETSWYLFEGISLEASGSEIIAKATHLQDVVTLQDGIELLGASKFNLRGRLNDMVDIAGKRGSLSEINQVLQNFSGVADGVVFMPPQSKSESGVSRLAAIVSLKPNVDKTLLRQYFREHLDSAFVPRPIFVVDKIEREESGKLPMGKMLDIYFSHLRKIS